MNDHEQLLEFAMNYAAAWSSGDPDRVASFFTDDGSLSINGGPPSVGRTAIAADARGFMTAFPGMVVSFDSLIPTELGTEFHWTLTGANAGPGGKGNRLKISGYELWRMGTDSLVAESKGYFDTDEYTRQLEHDD